MNKIPVCIIDDEEIARKGIRKLLQSDSDFEVLGEADSGKTALALIKNKRPQLVFLDIQMPEMNGFEVLQHLDESEVPWVIFVTAYDAYAIDAFKVQAFDYLLKPFDDGEFYRVLNRVKERNIQQEMLLHTEALASLAAFYRSPADKNQTVKNPKDDDRPAHITVTLDGTMRMLDYAEIQWISASEHYVEIHLNKETLLVREAISRVESRLDPCRFYRIHRSIIVNVSKISSLHPASHGVYELYLKNGHCLRLSRNRSTGLRKLLEA